MAFFLHLSLNDFTLLRSLENLIVIRCAISDKNENQNICNTTNIYSCQSVNWYFVFIFDILNFLNLYVPKFLTVLGLKSFN